MEYMSLKESYLKSILRHTRYRRPILISVGIFLFCSVVLPVLYSYHYEGTKRGSHFEYSSVGSPKDRLELQFNLLNVDPIARKADFMVQVDLLGDLQDGEGALTKNLTLDLRFKKMKLMAHQPIEPFTMTVPFIEGTVRDYPLEYFIAKFPISIYGPSRVPFHASLDGLLQLFKVRFNALSSSEIENDTTFRYLTSKPDSLITLTLYRPKTTLFICVFMAALMWVLAIAMVNLAWDAVFFQREVPPPLLSIGVTMLFALPTLRNSQPGVPAMGCFLDMLGFFWSIVFISISASAIIFNWVLGFKPQCFREIGS
ncbi:hypothetical protein DSO57_1015108 [Entomophthora muscae]|uniref:Uncharacterized protein n=1 Tax=Entomophthora muscae TaxID=34485 RepID=A0ACC2U320_9FUNG|nr:hypothetical protein DSO57_1015108 [Entomophthora muscae]